MSGEVEPPEPPLSVVPRIDIEVEGNVIITINGQQVSG